MIANMNEKGRQVKLLAAIAVLAMVVCAFAVVLPSDNVDAYDATDVKDGTVIVSSADDLSQALNDTNVSKIQLGEDIKADVVVPAGKTVTLDLYGYELTNDSSADEPTHTISVMPGASLTITDSSSAKTGTVDNVTHARAALAVYNGASVTIDGGNFTRSAETGTSANSWYVIRNEGDLTINGGTITSKVTAESAVNSSSIVNGWTTPDSMSNNLSIHKDGQIATMTINGGKVIGGGYIKNDLFGKMTITGGDLSGANAAVYSKGDLEITGGNFTVETENKSAVYLDEQTGFPATTTITGGNYKVSDSLERGAIYIIGDGNDADLSKLSADSMKTVTGKSAAKIVLENTDAATNVTLPTGVEVSGDGWLYKTYDKTNGNQYYYTEPTKDVSIENEMIVAVNENLGDVSITVPVKTPSGSRIILTSAGDRVALNYESTTLTVYGKVIGDSTTVTEGTVTIETLAEDVTIYGTVNLADGLEIGNTISINTGGNIVVLPGAEVTFVTNDDEDTANVIEQGKIDTTNGTLWVYGGFLRDTDVNTGECISGTGAVHAVNVEAVQPYCPNITINPLSENKFDVDTIDDLIAAQDKNLPISINKSIIIPANTEIDFTGKNVTFTNNAIITFDSGASFNIADSTFEKADGSDDSKIIAQDGSKLTIVNSMIFMVVDAGEKSSVSVDNNDVIYDNTTSEVKVGYGTTLYLSRSPVSTVEVYGTLAVEGTATIASGITLHVYQGGTLNVSGTLNVAGKIVFDDGSKGDISGTVAISNSNGGAGITSSGDVTVSGTMTVSASGNLVALDNYLTIEEGEFAIEGTLNMNGTLSGSIHDKGVISFNGEVESNRATIYIYDGITLTITSVTGRTLKISDEGVVEVPKAIASITDVSDGNEISLKDVKGTTITETVTSGNYTDSSRNSHRYYVCDMTVSGTVSEKGTMTIEGNPDEVQTNAYKNMRTGKVFVNETLGIGENATLNVVGNELVVAGSISCVAKNSLIEVDGGEVTVSGTITFGPDNSNKMIKGSNINAAYYTVQDVEAKVTAYYSGFDAAISAIGTAYQNTITIYGEVTANTTVDIVSGTVDMNKGSTLTIADGVTVTLQSGAKINGSGSTIVVKGTFTAMNYKEDLRATVDADVIRTNEPSRTWTSLANALEGAQSGDVITLAKPVTLSEDITIPAGVTVETSYKLDTYKYTMTVDGTFSADEDGSLAMSHEDGKVIANGVVVINSIGEDTTDRTSVLDDIDGAHFEIIDGADIGYYVTNLAYAAENVDNGTVTIIGNVSAQDVVFTLGKDESSLIIEVVSRQAAPGAEEEPITVLSFNSMELNGAILTIDSQSKVTGTVNVPCGDGSTDAVFDLASVSGIEIQGDSTETATGTTYEAYIGNAKDKTFTGTVGINAGTAILGANGLTVADNNADAAFNVAAGATLVVPDDTTLTADPIRNSDRVVINGTIEFDGGSLAGDSMTINGTMLVSENVTTSTTVNVNGTVTIADEKTLILYGKVAINDGATVTGSVDIKTTGYIVAFPGSDLDQAQIDWQIATGTSSAKTTAYYINGEVYATVYVDGAATNISLDGAIPTEDIDLTGYGTVDGWYETQENADSKTSDIGTQKVGIYSEVYANAPVANKFGTMSEGSGITLYVDGKTIENWYVGATYGYYLTVGTHTVSWDIRSGYSGDEVTATFNGASVTNGGTIEVTADMGEFTLTVNGATPASGNVSGGSSDDGMGLTDYLLIILVVLIVIMAIMVAMRLMRS